MSTTRSHRCSFNEDELAIVLLGLDELESTTANKVSPERFLLDLEAFKNSALLVSAIKRLRERLKS